jgi:hypothetical protein
LKTTSEENFTAFPAGSSAFDLLFNPAEVKGFDDLIGLH